MIAVTRNTKHTEDLLQLGASYVIDTSTINLYKTVMEVTNGQGADAAIEAIGGTAGKKLAFCVRPSGNFLAIGLLSGVQVNWGSIVKDAHVHANMFHLRHWNKQVSTEKWQDTFQQLITLVNEQKLMMMKKDSQYDLLDIHKAIE